MGKSGKTTKVQDLSEGNYSHMKLQMTIKLKSMEKYKRTHLNILKVPHGQNWNFLAFFMITEV